MGLLRSGYIDSFLDKFYVRQIAAFQVWLKQHGFSQSGVYICAGGQERWLQPGPISFIFCAASGLVPTLQKHSLGDSNEWHSLFRSFDYEIWTRKGSFQEREAPLRQGLSQKEKIEAIAIARDALACFLRGGIAAPATILPRFEQKADVDVAIWVNGELRGSRIVQELPFGEAVKKASVEASRDVRFKPLALEELGAARIEIALFSDLRMPLRHVDAEEKHIDFRKGYRVDAKGKRGWLLPAGLNNGDYTSNEDFLAHLVEKKAGISSRSLKPHFISMYEMDNFIESSDGLTVYDLRGPVIARTASGAKNTLVEMLRKGADFLSHMQQNDGNIPPTIDPLSGKTTQLDLPRLAFTAWSLAAADAALRSAKYKKTARSALAYVVSVLRTHYALSPHARALTAVYAHAAAVEAREAATAQELTETVIHLLPQQTYEPIRFLQLAVHIFTFHQDSEPLMVQGERFMRAVLDDFESKFNASARVDLTSFSELPHALMLLGIIRSDSKLIQKAEQITKWYISQQLPDGSFPQFPGAPFSYVRGTGKIFEVLCLQSATYAPTLERCLLWLREMQYDDENTFFVADTLRKKIAGGFRHDLLNKHSWIDSVGHVLLGGSRLIASGGWK